MDRQTWQMPKKKKTDKKFTCSFCSGQPKELINSLTLFIKNNKMLFFAR